VPRRTRPALAQEVAVDELAKNSGTQFDPVVVEALMTTIRRGEAGLSAEPISSASA
jgi:HD-GYP domain-containing protein (c-di-GMP phosphodiesterase class II)